MNILLALDSAMGIFNNVPPRIHYVELDLQMPCHPEFFELSSYAEMLTRSSFPRTRMKLIDAFQRLFSSPRDLKSAFHNETLCCWDMLYLIHGVCSLATNTCPSGRSNANTCDCIVVLFTHSTQHLFGNPMNRMSPTTLAVGPSSHVLESIKTALNNWKTLWDEAKRSLPRSSVSEMGFETSADSYWTLLRMIVQKFEANSANAAANEAYNCPNGTYGNDQSQTGTYSNGTSQRSSTPGLDFMPLEADSDSQGAHLRRILGK